MSIHANSLYSTPEAAEVLGLSQAQFRKLARRLQPAGSYVNPHYKSGPECPEWLGADLSRAKRWKEYKKMLSRRKQLSVRQAAAKKGAETKRKKLMDYVDTLEISIPEMPLEKLLVVGREDAIHFCTNGTGGDTDSLHRYAVNYLRHACSAYDANAISLRGKAAGQAAYLRLRERVLEAIAEQYPELEAECMRQESYGYERAFSVLS